MSNGFAITRVKLVQSHGNSAVITEAYYARGILALDKDVLLKALLGKVKAPALRGFDVAIGGIAEDAPRNVRECLHALLCQNENWLTRVVDVSHYLRMEDMRQRRSA